MSVIDSRQEAFPMASASSNNSSDVPPASASASPNRRRARTQELSAASASPPWLHQSLGRQDEQSPSQVKTTNVDNVEDHSSQAIARISSKDVNSGRQPSSSQRHHRTPSATRLTETLNRTSLMMRSDSASSHESGSQTKLKGCAIPNSPPNARRQQQLINSGINEIASSSTQPPMSQSRNRSGSDASFAGSQRSPSRQESQLPPSPSSRSIASFKRSLSRRSISSVNNDNTGSAAGVPDPLDPKGQLIPQQHRSDMPLEGLGVNEKRRLFGRREERSNSIASGKGMVRKVSSKSFFGINRDRSQDANASSDTLGSASSSNTAKIDAKKAGESKNSHWSRRSRKNDAIKSDDVEIIQTAKETNRASHNLNGTAEEEFSDLTPRGEGSRTSAELSSGYQGTATNGADLQDRGEGLPKRLSGWLSHILTTSTSSSDDGTGHLSASDSNATVRRKSSALSLSKNDSTDRLSSTLMPSPQIGTASSTSSHASTSRPRNTGLLSTLTASGKGRSDSASSPNGGSSRSGLDRALRYFMDSGDQQQSQEEGMWLLGVWHGPAQSMHDADTGKQHPVIAVINPSPNVRDSRSSTLETDNSSASRQGSDIDQDDASTENSSRRTRETSPAASAGTGGSLSRASKVQTPEDDVILARNPPTPQSARTTANIATPVNVTSNALQSSRQQERSRAANNGNASYMASFQADFSSRIWCTYRSQFPPISRDGTISNQAEMAAAEAAAAAQSSSQATGADDATISGKGTSSGGGIINQFGQIVASPLSSQGTLGTALGMHQNNSSTMTSSLSDKMGIPGLWSRATAAAQSYGLAGRAGLTTDAGWGCMLRTGQSVLANALLNVHLGRAWRRESGRAISEGGRSEEEQMRLSDYAKYVELLSWFMDEPSLACPFGVHRMAREGKRLGKEVGEWFGPSTAAGAIKKLVDDFPDAGLGVSLASDGVIYLDQVRAQAHLPSNSKQRGTSSWTRPVLVLIGVRLGLDGVHPMYYDSIKATFSFPHSVGIAGGRPSSSYYFMGYQGNSLFYLDPHHVRSCVPFRHSPPNTSDVTSWWLQAYSEVELSTFHNDRPRRMPMKSLDPSMLLGFLIDDEESLQDFVNRVKALPRPIFSVLDSMPKWMMEGEDATLDDEDKALESLSESSIDDGMGGGTEMGAMETLNGQDLDEDSSGRTQLNNQPLQSTMSGNTMTPRTESTFEFVDRHSTGLSPKPLPDKARLNHMDGSKEKTESQSINGSDLSSAWEEVGIESAQRKEGMSSPVEAAFPQMQ